MPDHHALTPAQWAAIGREIRAQRERDGLPPYRGIQDMRLRDVLLTEFLIGEMLAGRWKGTQEARHAGLTPRVGLARPEKAAGDSGAVADH